MTTKLKTTPKHTKFSFLRIAKNMMKSAKKRPVVGMGLALLIVAIVGVGSYQLLGRAHTQNEISAKAINVATKQSKTAPAKKLDTAAAPVAAPAASRPAATEQAKPSSAGTTTADEPAKSVGGVMSKPGCYAGCPTPNPSFSIVAPGSVTVALGTTAGPFTASTSNGSVVDWGTPQYNGGGFGPYGYTNDSMRGTTTLQYFIRAEQNVAPGVYTLYMNAYQSSTQPIMVRTSMTVTVAP